MINNIYMYIIFFKKLINFYDHNLYKNKKNKPSIKLLKNHSNYDLLFNVINKNFPFKITINNLSIISIFFNFYLFSDFHNFQYNKNYNQFLTIKHSAFNIYLINLFIGKKINFNKSFNKIYFNKKTVKVKKNHFFFANKFNINFLLNKKILPLKKNLRFLVFFLKKFKIVDNFNTTKLPANIIYFNKLIFVKPKDRVKVKKSFFYRSHFLAITNIYTKKSNQKFFEFKNILENDIFNTNFLLKFKKKIIKKKLKSLVFSLKFNFSKFSNLYKYQLNYFLFFIAIELKFKKYFFEKNKTIKINNKNVSNYLDKYNKHLMLTFMLLNDFFDIHNINKKSNNLNFFSNPYILNSLYLLNYSKQSLNKTIKEDIMFKESNMHVFTNHYPIFFLKKKNLHFFSKFKASFDVDYINYIQFSAINYLEFFFKKKIFLRVSNNFFKTPENINHLKRIFENYKNYQPRYMKNFLISDFLELLWFSLHLKDLNFISNWISKFMEKMHFKNHKKFLMFFQNIVKKYGNVFIDVLKIKGFLFDIRGKVGVTGSSKKRHICFKVGNLGKSTKKFKIEFNQNLVRTYSGVLGLTYIISY